MKALSGVTSEGLKMKVLPAARAGAHFHSALEKGQWAFFLFLFLG
jgi:hypothetical protein